MKLAIGADARRICFECDRPRFAAAGPVGQDG